MALTIVYGRAGSGKSTYCFNKIKDIINTEKKIFLITPEQFSFTTERRLMETLQTKSIFNAEVITLSRMAYRVMQEVGENTKTPLSKSAMNMLLFYILQKEKSKLHFLGSSNENLETLTNAITEFEKHSITPNRINEQIENTENSYLKTKLQDLYCIYNNYRVQIENKYIDEESRLTKLKENLDKTDLIKNSVILIDEFSGFTTQEYEILEIMIKLAKQVIITVCTDSIIVSKNPESNVFYPNQVTLNKILNIADKLDEQVEFVPQGSLHRFKTPELKHIEKNLYNIGNNKYKEEPKNLQVFLAKNPYTEVEQVARKIVELIKNEKFRYSDISVIVKRLDAYTSLIRAIFEEYEIPVFIDEKREVSQNKVIQYILAIIQIFQKNWSYESVMQYIKTGFLQIEDEELFKFENYCQKWGINYSKWKQEFTYGKLEKDAKAEISHLEELRKQIVNPLLQLQKNIGKEKKVNDICKELYNFLQQQQIDKKVLEYINNLQENNIDLAKEYEMSYKLILNLLDEIAMLFADEKMSFDKFLQIFIVGLQNSGLGKIPGTLDQVIVGDVERSRSHKVKAIFILGVNDGTFPSSHREEGFLNDEERKKLEEQGISLAKGTLDQLYQDNFNIYKAFTTAEEKLYLSYVSSDAEGKALRPSMLIRKIKKIFPLLQEQSDMINTEEKIFTQKSTYESLLKQIAKLSDNEKIEQIWYDVYNYYSQTEEEKLQRDIKGLFYTNMPEKISQKQIDKLYGNKLKTSVSKLESYRNCPFSYFLKYGLRLKEKEELKMKTLNTGNFMHEIIDSFFKEAINSSNTLKEMTEENIKEIIDKIVEEKLQQPSYYIFTVTKKYQLLVGRLKRILTKAIKYMVRSIVLSDFEVFGTEVEFNYSGKNKPILITLEDGKQVEITGKIDRVDIGKNKDNKYIRIIDYKSSVKDIDLNQVYAGMQIQLLTYMDEMCKEEEALPAGAFYFGLIEPSLIADKKLSEEEIEEKIKNHFKMKGLLVSDIEIVKMQDTTLQKGSSNIIPAYIDSKGNLSEKRTSGITKEQFQDLQKYVEQTIKQISKEILSGKIDLSPYYQKKKTPCEYCSYKGICGFQPGFCQNKYNYVPEMAKNEVLDLIHEKIKKK